jgi:hypothetical protein
MSKTYQARASQQIQEVRSHQARITMIHKRKIINHAQKVNSPRTLKIEAHQVRRTMKRSMRVVIIHQMQMSRLLRMKTSKSKTILKRNQPSFLSRTMVEGSIDSRDVSLNRTSISLRTSLLPLFVEV